MRLAICDPAMLRTWIRTAAEPASVVAAAHVQVVGSVQVVAHSLVADAPAVVAPAAAAVVGGEITVMSTSSSRYHQMESRTKIEAIMGTQSSVARQICQLFTYFMPTMIGALTFISATTASAQESFKTPDDAAAALYAAAKSGDSKAALTVFGAEGADIISSGDEVLDRTNRAKFVETYDAKHHVSVEGDKKAILTIGSDDWPFPVPIVRADNGWRFDAAAGRQEILFRRIGRNELNTIQACLAYVDAQNDYSQLMRADTGVAVYAQRVVSEPGKKDGLYWPTRAGEEPSPLGELVAQATAQGYKASGRREPFHGYYYKILTRQGPDAPGGAHDYVVNGKMIGGFALVAYPATYRNSGVMTFLVNHDGTVFQKDLGPRTVELAERIKSFNPDSTWTKADASAQ